MSHRAFPKRTLGAAEPWGRQIETQARQVQQGVKEVRQVLANIGRRQSARYAQFASEIDLMSLTTDRIDSSLKIVSERHSTSSYETNLPRNAFGSTLAVGAPPWADAGIATVALEAVSDPGNGWLARIDVMCEPHPITSYSTYLEGRRVAVGGMGWDPSSPTLPPDVLMYETFPAVRFLSEADTSLYIRPYSVQVGGGSTSVTHRMALTVNVLWVGSGV